MAEAPTSLSVRDTRSSAVLLAIAMSGVLLLAAPAPSVAQTLVLQFNRSGTIADPYRQYFNLWNDVNGTDGSNYSFGLSWTDGVAGSGGIRVFQNSDTTATFRQSSWNFLTNGASVSVCVLVHANGLMSDHEVQLGFLNVTNNGLDDNTGVAFESYCFTPRSPGVWALHERVRSLGTLVDTELGDVSVVPGNWYKFLVSMTNTGGASGDYKAACDLQDYGTDGVTTGASVVTVPTMQNHTGRTDITVRAISPGLRAFEDAGIEAWDNFVVYTARSEPVFTLGLTDAVGTVGSTVSFGVIAEGPGAIRYSWYTNGVLVPAANSRTYSTPPLDVGSASIIVRAANDNGTNSSYAQLMVLPVARVTGSYSNDAFSLAFPGQSDRAYILEGTSDFTTWVPIATNQTVSSPKILTDPEAGNFRSRFYRVLQEP